MRKGLACLALLLGFWLVAAPAHAQELTTGTIAGKVMDPAGKPIPGAVIISTSQSGTRTAEADVNGNYILPFLRPGLYTLRVEAPGGFNTVIQNDVVVSLNQRTQINFTLEPGKTETVTVKAASPLVDTKSTSSGTSFNYKDFADAVPIGRSFTDTFAVAPGVVSGLGTGQGNYSISGASGLENSYIIDGVNVTNTGFGGIGAYNIIYGSLGTGVTSEFLDEVQIKEGGFEAEYGQALGGIINTIVKSGTNDFKGSVVWYSTPNAFRSTSERALLDTGTANVVGQQTNDFAFSVGGPIVKDKLFYFVSYNPVLTATDIRAQRLINPAYTPASAGVAAFDEMASSNAYSVTDPLAFPSAGRTLGAHRIANNYAAKISWQASPKHQVELTFFGDPARGRNGPQRDVNNAIGQALSDQYAIGGGASEISYGAHNQALKWSAVFTPKFFMEAQVSHKNGRFRETSALNDTRYRDRRNLLEFIRGADTYDDPILGITSLDLKPVETFRGGVGTISNQDDQNTQYSLKFTNILGKHEIKYGAEYDNIRYRERTTYTGPSIDVVIPTSDPLTGIPDGGTIPLTTRGGVLVDVRNGSGADPTIAFDGSNTYRVVRGRIGPELPFTTAKDMNLFLQDTWSIGSHFTIKAGLRWTQETIDGAGQFTLPIGSQNFTDPSGVTYRIFTPGSTTFTPNSYTFGGNLAPRVGVTWDILGNGKSRAWANWGRYYERVPNDLAVRAFSNEVGISREQFTDRDLTTWDGGAVFTQGFDETNVVAGTKLPFNDELSGGFAFEVTPNSSFEVRGIYRTQGRVLEDVQVNAIEQIQNFYYGYAYGYPYDPFGGSVGTAQSTNFPARTFGAYELGNPGTKAVPSGGLFGFPKGVRRYKALELIYTKRFSDNWSVYANYRFARLIGNYEGLFRNDNGQSDPNITSQYDFPNSPLMSGQFISGPLPADVTHVLKVYPSYTFNNKLRVGTSFQWISGTPRTSLLAHPIYQNSGEIPGINPVYGYWVDTGGPNLTIRRTTSLKDALTDVDAASGVFLVDYDAVKRGNLGRTPDYVTMDLHADYPLQMGKTSIRFFLDIFNIFNTQDPQTFDDNVEVTAGVLDPDFLKPLTFQSSRQWRMGARWEF
jgi:Carboxypeptidase regulatory-like domain